MQIQRIPITYTNGIASFKTQMNNGSSLKTGIFQNLTGYLIKSVASGEPPKKSKQK
jgi:hypothetical protein